MSFPPVVPSGVPLEAVPDESVDVAAQVIDELERVRVRRALATLPLNERLALCWRFGIVGEPAGHREVARRLNVSLGTAVNLERRGLELMRQRWPTAA